MKTEKDRVGGFSLRDGKLSSGSGNGTLEISEIVPLQHLSRHLQIPPLICGVVEVRGEEVPVMDLRKQPDTQAQCIVVVHVSLMEGEYVKLGLIVDSLDLVLQLKNYPLVSLPVEGDKENMELSDLAVKLQQAIGAWSKQSTMLAHVDECKEENGD